MDALDIRARSGTRAPGFVWELAMSKLEIGIVRIAQVNLVLLLTALNRVDGGFANLGPNVIDYTVISPVLADAKFRSQRTIRTMDPKGAVLVYFSGKLLCVGTKSALDAMVSIYKAVRVLNNYRTCLYSEFVIGNISFVNSVFKGTCGHILNMDVLLGVCQFRDMLIRYEPDLFPGCVMTLLMSGGEPATGSVVVYSTGRFILAGCRTVLELRAAVTEVDHVLRTMPGLCGRVSTASISENAEYQDEASHMQALSTLPEFAKLDIGFDDIDCDPEIMES